MNNYPPGCPSHLPEDNNDHRIFLGIFIKKARGPEASRGDTKPRRGTNKIRRGEDQEGEEKEKGRSERKQSKTKHTRDRSSCQSSRRKTRNGIFEYRV